MEKIAAIVVTYNRKQILSQCLDSLLSQTVELDILVIDNASTDATAELFEQDKDHVLYFNTGSNLGGAGGFHYGMKKAIELGYEYLWLMDDDTLPSPTALEILVRKDQELRGQYGYLSSKALWKDNSICITNIQKKTKWKRVKDFDRFQSIQYATFVSFFVKATMVAQIGLPYQEFFIWGDDLEYTRRISKRFKSYFVPKSVVTHSCTANIRANITVSSPERIGRFLYKYRNEVVVYRQDGLDGLLFLLIRNARDFLKILLQAENKREKIRILIKSTINGFSFYPKIEYPSIRS